MIIVPLGGLLEDLLRFSHDILHPKGEKWGCNGVGDDLYSYGFDGAHLWSGGRSSLVIPHSQSMPAVKKGDNIGVALDLTVPIITFFYNGMKIPGYFRNFNLDGMFFPVVSMSAQIRSVHQLNSFLVAFCKEMIDLPGREIENRKIFAQTQGIGNYVVLEAVKLMQKKPVLN